MVKSYYYLMLVCYLGRSELFDFCLIFKVLVYILEYYYYNNRKLVFEVVFLVWRLRNKGEGFFFCLILRSCIIYE